MFRFVWSVMSWPPEQLPLSQQMIPACKASRLCPAHCHDPHELYLGQASEASGIHTVKGWSL